MENKRSEKLEVIFKTSMSDGEWCICDACYDVSRVMKVTLPETKFFGNGNGLSTEYSEYWLCAPCRTKLVHALDFPDGVQ